MKKRMDRTIRNALAVFIIALLILVIWANFFYFKKCESKECFDNYLVLCSRAKFVNKGNMSFEYKILGETNGGCVVNVKLLRADLTNQDSLALNNKEMKCSIPAGYIAVPESDISACHGLLREGLQDLIIKKMHTYIVQNLNAINLGNFTQV